MLRGSAGGAYVTPPIGPITPFPALSIDGTPTVRNTSQRTARETINKSVGRGEEEMERKGKGYNDVFGDVIIATNGDEC